MNEPFNPALSHSISELRFPLAALVVFGHANVLQFPLTDIHSEYGIIQYPILLLSQILFSPAVPLFFIISGILFFWNVDSYDHATYKSKMSKRVKTLLLPYLIWNIIYDIPYIAKQLILGGGGRYPHGLLQIHHQSLVLD